ncbi:OmpA family protein [Flavobacteriaceae bacterium F08102]|nr:OmpA family protein [Flavobacteriaceae bacterium F08102]
MKDLLRLVVLLTIFATTFTGTAQEKPLDRNYFQLSPRFGYDFPTYNNNTPYIDYEGGVDLGVSLDYYWNWFGLGIDFDYIMNKPKSTYPTTAIFESDRVTPIKSFSLSEDGITRMFYGFGPNFQYRTRTGKFIAELNTRAGLATIEGGRTYLEGSSGRMVYPLNFHAGYKESNVLSFKGQLRFTYMISKKIGIHVGGYYMRHLDVEELSESGRSALYQPLFSATGSNREPMNILADEPVIRTNSRQSDISSFGGFVGVTFQLNPFKKANNCPVCGEDHFPHCSETCVVRITAKDKFTGELLPNAKIVLEDLEGNLVKSDSTNQLGVATFSDIKAADYVIKGKLLDVDLRTESISKSEFEKCQKNSRLGIEKIVLYADENFILKGNVIECNLDKGIEGVDIKIRDKVNFGEKNSISDVKGDFMFRLKQFSTYALNGRKDGYYASEVEIDAGSYDRNKTLFIDFEMCVDPCGKAINLENIHFDFNKADILPASIPDLQRVIKLMRDNPTIHVEMTSHTDSQGTDEYNRKLSQRRADATVNYIVRQGISRDRLKGRGAGESELKNKKCVDHVPCTDEEHRINRRTEFKVICF